MLWNVDTVVRRVATLMDDPAQDEFDKDYVIPFLNLKYEDLTTELSMLGLDYQEVITVISPITAGTVNLDQYMDDGQPLESLMFPRRIEWKELGMDDTYYQDATLVDDLDDFPDGVIGIQEYAWSGGTIRLAPSGVDVTLRVTFNAMAMTLVDPEDKTIRGATNILAYQVAELLYQIRGNPQLAKVMLDQGSDALDTFERAAVMRDQAKLRRSPPMHPRFNVGGFFIASNSNK